MPKGCRALSVLLAIGGCFAADRTDSDLQPLFASHNWFQLRDAVERTADAPAFYRGAVACAFNRVDDAERFFRAVIRIPAGVEQAVEAHGLLAHAYMRTGRYHRTYAHLAAMQKLAPDSPGLRSGLALFSALSVYPDLSAQSRRRSEVRMSNDFFIPVGVNGKTANYGFDSGMDISLMSEAEAKRLGLPIQEVRASTLKDGASGNDVPIRFVVMDRLVVGKFELRHVVFLVLGSGALPFSELPADRQGILGIPVLVSFGAFGWTNDHMFRIGGPPERRRAARPNLCFQSVTLVVEGTFGSGRIQAWLDTGSDKSYLTQRFAQRFPEVISAGKEAPGRLRGVGGSTEIKVTTLADIRFDFGGAPLVPRPAEVLPKDERVDRDWYDVWLGMDLLGAGREVRIDFRSLTFTLQ